MSTPRTRHPQHDPAAMSVSELFDPETAEDGQPAPEVSLSALALALNVTPSRLISLVTHGYLTLVRHSAVPGASVVRLPPKRALDWMRGWFLPARAKALFSAADIADLLNIAQRDVVKISARYGLPTTFDPGLGGLLWSTFAVRQMMRALGGEVAAERVLPRFDRQAMLHALLETDPKRAPVPPTFSQQLEDEIRRVSALPEDQRRLRVAALWDQLQDAKTCALAYEKVPASDKLTKLERMIRQGM
jgi:hypothetical protein